MNPQLQLFAVLSSLSKRARLLIIVLALSMQACAVSGELSSARQQFKNGSTYSALQTLDTAEVSRRNRLLLLLDKALVAQAAGQYEQSIVAFEDAFQLIDQLDYVSVRDQTSALLTNDRAIRYSGEFSERLWIHTFQMINYLLLDQPQGAAVEARRAVALFEKHADVLNDDLFTRYLMALSFDAAGQTDSAAVEYRKLGEQLGHPPGQRHSENGEKEVVLLIASGFIPPKLPGDLIINLNARISFPFYPDSLDRAPYVDVLQGDTRLETVRIDTNLLPVAKHALAKRGKTIAARHALRLGAKYQLTQSIRRQDPLAADIARIFFLLIEQADTRSWETLPAWLSLVRVAVPSNASSLSVEIDDGGYTTSGIYRHQILLAEDSRQTEFRFIRTGVGSEFTQGLAHNAKDE